MWRVRLSNTIKSGGGVRGLLMNAMEWITGFRAHMGWAQVHRPDLFGEPVHVWTQGLMRGRSAWSPSERELFGSFTASIESCPF